MKLQLSSSCSLTKNELFTLLKEPIENMTGKRLANIMWLTDRENVVSARVTFCDEEIDTDVAQGKT